MSSRVPPGVFDIIASAHPIEFFVGNKIDKMGKVIGHGIKTEIAAISQVSSWLGLCTGAFLKRSSLMSSSLGNGRHPSQHCLFLGREVRLSLVNADLVRGTGFFEDPLLGTVDGHAVCTRWPELITQVMSSLSALLSWSVSLLQVAL